MTSPLSSCPLCGDRRTAASTHNRTCFSCGLATVAGMDSLPRLITAEPSNGRDGAHWQWVIEGREPLWDISLGQSAGIISSLLRISFDRRNTVPFAGWDEELLGPLKIISPEVFCRLNTWEQIRKFEESVDYGYHLGIGAWTGFPTSALKTGNGDGSKNDPALIYTPQTFQSALHQAGFQVYGVWPVVAKWKKRISPDGISTIWALVKKMEEQGGNR